MGEFGICITIAVACVIILRYIVSMLSDRVRRKMADIAFNNVKIDSCYVLIQSKGMSRLRYALVTDKKIVEGTNFVYYRTVAYNGFLMKYELDDMTFSESIDEFMRKYEVTDKPLSRLDIEITNSL